MPDREIQLGDLVKNRNGNDIIGYVITKYTTPGLIPTTLIDVRTDERIYYDSPIGNWETVTTVEELEQDLL